MGMVMAPGVGCRRDDRSHDFCDQSVGHVHESSYIPVGLAAVSNHFRLSETFVTALFHAVGKLRLCLSRLEPRPTILLIPPACSPTATGALRCSSAHSRRLRM